MQHKRNDVSPFGIRVKNRLNELNMTQKELAESIGCNENYLTDIMRGRRAGHKYRNQIESYLEIDEQQCHAASM